MSNASTSAPTKVGDLRESSKVYLVQDIDNKISGAIRTESANREAMIDAKISTFESDVVDIKINALRNEIGDEILNGNGINYAGVISSVNDLQLIDNPQHGDLYVVEGSSTADAYIYTVYKEAIGDEEPVTRSKWVATHLSVNLSGYVRDGSTPSINEFQTVKTKALNANDKITKMIVHLSSLKNKTAIPNTEKTLESVNDLLGDVINALREAVTACLD